MRGCRLVGITINSEHVGVMFVLYCNYCARNMQFKQLEYVYTDLRFIIIDVSSPCIHQVFYTMCSVAILPRLEVWNPCILTFRATIPVLEGIIFLKCMQYFGYLHHFIRYKYYKSS